RKIDKDRQEMATYAAGLLKSRRELERKLTALKLKKSTLAAQIAVARGKSTPLDHKGAFETFERVESRMDEDVIQAEVAEETGRSQDEKAPGLERDLARAKADADLAALKDKMGLPPRGQGR